MASSSVVAFSPSDNIYTTEHRADEDKEQLELLQLE
jgi:hypothetical protein